MMEEARGLGLMEVVREPGLMLSGLSPHWLQPHLTQGQRGAPAQGVGEGGDWGEGQETSPRLSVLTGKGGTRMLLPLLSGV